MAPEPNAQTFSFETVAALVAALMEKGGTVGTKEFELMATMDGSRSASAFQHQFRKVKAHAKELLQAQTKGAGVSPATPKAKSKGQTPLTSGEKGTGKRSRKTTTTMTSDADDDESPMKKVKSEPIEDAFATTMGEDDGDED